MVLDSPFAGKKSRQERLNTRNQNKEKLAENGVIEIHSISSYSEVAPVDNTINSKLEAFENASMNLSDKNKNIADVYMDDDKEL